MVDCLERYFSLLRVCWFLIESFASTLVSVFAFKVPFVTIKKKVTMFLLLLSKWIHAEFE